MSLRARAFSAVRWTAILMAAKAGIAFLQVVIIARLLDPSEIGLVALALTTITTFQILSDMGLSNALIHHDDLSEIELSSLYWVNVLSGVLFTGTVYAASGLISDFYGKPELAFLISISSIYFIIWAIGQQHRALAQKYLNFRSLAIVEVSAFLCGFLVTIGLAWSGFGPSSVVIGFVCNAVINTVSSWIFLANGWRPLLVFRFARIKRLLKFGVETIGVTLASTLALQSDIIMVGRGFSASAVGVYFQPRELCLRIMFVVNPIVTRVSFPLLAQSKRNLSRIRSIYLNTVKMTCSINFPIYFIISFFSREIIEVVLGETWIASTPVLRVLAIWCAIRSIGNPAGPLLLALGETRRALAATISVMIGLFVLCAFTVQFGLQAVAIGLVAFYVVTIPGFWFYLLRPTCSMPFYEYHAQIAIPALLGAACAASGWLAAYYVEGSLLRLIVGGGVSGIVYLALSYFFNRAWLTAMVELVAPKLRPVQG